MTAKYAIKKMWAIPPLICSSRFADGTVHESSIQRYEVHDEMKGVWPKEELVPGYR